jgi:hypothetical protein
VQFVHHLGFFAMKRFSWNLILESYPVFFDTFQFYLKQDNSNELLHEDVHVFYTRINLECNFLIIGAKYVLSKYFRFNLTITILRIIHHPVFYLKARRFRDWILSPSSIQSISNPVQRQRLALSIGPIWVGSTWRWRQNPVSETSCF